MPLVPSPYHRWYMLWLNPEPWAVGDISVGKTSARLSPNPNLVAFQNAVREALSGETKVPKDFRRLEFFFWRQQARYIDAGDRVRQRNQADATNCQKGLEDALQGVLIENDRDIVDIRSVMCDQGPKVEPLIIIHAQRVPAALYGYEDIPVELLEQALRGPQIGDKKGDRWQDADDYF